MIAVIVLFAPLFGAVIAGFGWRLLGEKTVLLISTGLLFLAAGLSWLLFFDLPDHTQHLAFLRFVTSDSLISYWGIRLDRLTAIMLVVVTTVSALVHLYSFGYMHQDPAWKEGEIYKPRFFAYLSFFTFAMLMLVTSDNLLQMFFGWEGVGLASYLLIGFYYRKANANAAAIKAFVVNRIGDFGFALGIFGLFWTTGGVSFDVIFNAAPDLAQTKLSFLGGEWNAANLLVGLLFIGAMGKSAQFFLHTWLPDAMEGPTPVSALIHAATMVTAGVFLICRMSPLVEYAPEAKNLIVFIGALTALFAASVGLVQNDIKRVIAYSTCSQLGYMFVAAGLGVYSVAMFHLLTHAFFKALLFLGAGSVIHAMHHEQDMRAYGGLRKKIPLTFWAMMIGTLSITGVGIPLTHYGFAGFLSKDSIIETAWAGSGNIGDFAFWALVSSAALTSFYSWRLMFLTFYGAPCGDMYKHENAHESPLSMLVPLGVLAIGAVFSGMVFFTPFFGKTYEIEKFFGIGAEKAHTVNFMLGDESSAAVKSFHVAGTNSKDIGAIFIHSKNHMLDEAHHAPKWVKVSPFLAMLTGFIMAWIFYIFAPTIPGRLAQNQRFLYKFLLNKWYFDQIYDLIFTRPLFWLGRQLWKSGDGIIIDGFLNGVALGVIPSATRFYKRIQSGYIFSYALFLVLGLIVLVTWVSISGGVG